MISHNLVVVGGCGFVGFHLSKYLAEEGLQVTILDDFSNSELDDDFHNLIEMQNVTFHKIDASVPAVEKYIDGDSIVLNLAAINGTASFYTRPFEVLKHSILPSINLPQICSEKNAAAYYYFGSSESYAGGVNLGFVNVPTPERVPLVIQDPSEPRWSYALAKIAGEVAAFSAQKQFGLRVGIFRLHNIYGPRMGFQHVVPDLIRNFSKGNFQVKNATHTRSFMFVEDAVKSIYSLLKSDFLEECKPEIINIGSDLEISIEELANIIQFELGINHQIEKVSDHEGSVSRRRPNTSLLRRYYSEDATSLSEGVKRTILYYQKSGLI